MRLHTSGIAQGFGKPIVARLTTKPLTRDARKNTALVLSKLGDENDLHGYSAVIVQDRTNSASMATPLVHSVQHIDHLHCGHVVVLEPRNGFVRTLFRPESPHNTLFATERCNSNCLMCSQPPVEKDDMDALTERNLKLIDLMSPAPEYLCITGGEPTLETNDC